MDSKEIDKSRSERGEKIRDRKRIRSERKKSHSVITRENYRFHIADKFDPSDDSEYESDPDDVNDQDWEEEEDGENENEDEEEDNY